MSLIWDEKKIEDFSSENMEEKIHSLLANIQKQTAAASLPGTLFIGFATQKDSALIKTLLQLSPELNNDLLSCIHSFLKSKQGASGKEIIKFAGAIDTEELKQMEEAIESDCEKVDMNEW